MNLLFSAMIASACLAGCAAAAPAPMPEGPVQAAPASPAQTSAGLPAPPVVPPQTRLPSDLPPCPGINPDIRRPAGSNCLGITLDQCGADRAQDHVGKQGTPEIRKALSDMAKDTTGGNFRWIPHNTPVIEDLRSHRFNVELDQNGVIERIDCY